jgi:hypothetical protein
LASRSRIRLSASSSGIASTLPSLYS